MELVRTGGVLRGLKVVELSAFVAVPLGGMTLSQLGAEVTRVDPLGGGIDFRRWPQTIDGTSLYWAGLNKGKKSVAVDGRSAAGQDLIKRLITAPGEGAGIFVTNLAPSWLSYEALQAERPDLIMVTLTGSPGGAIAVDYTVNASAGYPFVTGSDGEAVNHVLPAWDLIAGNMVALAVLAADRWRTQTGEGALVELSLSDVAFATVGHLGHVAEVVVNDEDRQSYGNYLYGSFGRDFVTADHKRVMVTALTPRQWSALLAATSTGEAMAEVESELGVNLIDEGNRFNARTRIAAVLDTWFSNHDYTEVSEILDSHGVCWGPYQSFRELVELDPRMNPEQNPMWARVDQPGAGTYPMPASPISFSAIPRLPPRPAPSLGADTEAILVNVLRLSESELRRLRDERVI